MVSPLAEEKFSHLAPKSPPPEETKVKKVGDLFTNEDIS